MGSGSEQQELGVAFAQIKAASADAAETNGVSRIVAGNSAELNDRTIGAVGAILLATGVVSLLTDYALPIIGGCVAGAVCIGAYAWLQRRRVNRIRQQHMRDLARKKMQEDGYA